MLKRGRPVGDIAGRGRARTGCGTPCASRRSDRTTSRVPWRRRGEVAGDRSRPRSDRDRGAGRAADGRGRLRRRRPARDLAKIAVVERHLARGASGSVSSAASACSAARSDRPSRTTRTTSSCVGSRTRTSMAVVERLVELGGGNVVVDDGRVVAECPLPVAGLLSDRAAGRRDRRRAAPATRRLPALGWTVKTPFLTIVVPRPIGDPVAEDHRPRAGRRRPVRERSARVRRGTDFPHRACALAPTPFTRASS